MTAAPGRTARRAGAAWFAVEPRVAPGVHRARGGHPRARARDAVPRRAQRRARRGRGRSRPRRGRLSRRRRAGHQRPALVERSDDRGRDRGGGRPHTPIAPRRIVADAVRLPPIVYAYARSDDAVCRRPSERSRCGEVRRATRVEASSPDAAMKGYLALSKGAGRWAEVALYAAPGWPPIVANCAPPRSSRSICADFPTARTLTMPANFWPASRGLHDSLPRTRASSSGSPRAAVITARR